MAAADPELQSFLDKVNSEYEKVHLAFEHQFWGTKMALSTPSPADGKTEYSVKNLTETQAAMESYLADKALLATTREWRAKGVGSAEQQRVLVCFEKTFLCYIMESDEAKALREKGAELENELQANRNTLQLGYTPAGGEFVEASSVQLRNLLRTSEDEGVRKAAYEGLRGIGKWVVDSGFAEIVKTRNRLARAQGYVDFYDYKVTAAEGFGKKKLFEILDTLETRTRQAMQTAREALAARDGAAALEPWNMPHALSGEITPKLDPYFPFSKAVDAWGRTFAALGIEYKGGTLVLDLLDRKHKYSNGFCHWPQPAWRKPDGSWQPSLAHFTSLADPTAVGSGLTALSTLMHEAGHAAHFANVLQPSPLFSQERAPTSVAYAENQSMFLDALVDDAAWRSRYAVSEKGEVLPWAVHEEEVRAKHPFKVFELRSMIAVPYFEKALYELADEEVTAERIARLADEVEASICGGAQARPLLSVPHIISDEASCYYHGYVLAEMSVRQTRHHFLKDGGVIVDNPAVGKELAEKYWEAGNSAAFLDLVENMTGKPLTGDAWVADLEEPLEAHLAAERKDYDAGLKAAPSAATTASLNMRVTLIDGDAVIADSETDGGFGAACEKYAAFVSSRVAAAKAKA